MGDNLEKLRFVFQFIAFRSKMSKHFVLRIILMSVSQLFMDTTKVDFVQETLGTSEEQLLLIIQAYEDESMG